VASRDAEARWLTISCLHNVTNESTAASAQVNARFLLLLGRILTGLGLLHYGSTSALLDDTRERPVGPLDWLGHVFFTSQTASCINCALPIAERLRMYMTSLRIR
jgi:hypothetical protein